MFSTRVARLIAGKVGYAVSCFLAAVLLVVAGYAHKAVADLSALGGGITIGGSSSVGAMNILVMGLESRTNFQGQCLSAGLLTAMHAGNVASCEDQTVGSQDTDTLILVHIFAGGQKAVGFSIPRDDLVTYPKAYYDGITTGKIDQAYYFAYVTSLNSTYGSSMSSNDRYLKANQAGQAAEIATVESVTGVHIDNYAVMNLAGFFTLAQDFGGIEVCVTPTTVNGTADANLYDIASGWNAVADGYNLKKGGSQYLHLAADQALAFVRDRDSLPDTDLSRTHRQQAVIDYVIWELKHENAFSDLGQLNALLGDAKQWLVVNNGFNLFDFATNMSALNGNNLKFYTLPIAGYADIDLNGSMQDVNDIDVSYIQQVVNKAFNPPPPVAPSGKSAVKKKAAPIPAASTVTVGRLQRRVHGGPGRQRLPGAGLPRLQGGRRRRRVGAVADRGRPAPRCSTARARRPTRPRSRPTSAPPPRRSRRCPPSTWRCCSAPGRPSCRPRSPRRHRRPRLSRPRPPRRRPTTARPAAR